MRARLARLIQHPWFDRTILTLIVINAICLALETDASVMERYGPLLHALDKAILAVFVLEIGARLIVDFRGFWRDPWRIFDFCIVAIALIPATGSLSALRAFRILRVLRLVSSVPAMRRVVGGLLSALPGMGSIVLLLGLVFFVFSVISTKLFAQAFPDWFGSLSASAYTLFQIMTLESWSMGIVRPVMEVYPYAWMLFVPFIIMTAFTVLNLFIGVIVDAMQSEHEAAARAERDAMMSENELILQEIRALRAEVQEMRAGR
ncbi:Ion transport protein [Pseudoruegeria aquimaris]|uniref:Ion transport protein n=1 Tax=Pseudoruegeria aquimaris TaxID=393663 RepID=A0A1Y5RBG1_9RHOB|nr:ion transporter [Pseudoruegeria aquimaris]SLN12387.1 Ion transport protein [Pseudoruegeria aquimaris]